MKLTKRQFDRIVKRTEMNPAGKTVAGIYLVLVRGFKASDAAKQAQVSPAAISRALKRFPKRICPHCGQAIPRRG